MPARRSTWPILSAPVSPAFDDGRREALVDEDLGADRLDYAYALTVHRTQAATVDRAHVLADGGGRELGYVAMSRARGTSHVYVVADDADQAAEDLGAEWHREVRQRWSSTPTRWRSRTARVGPTSHGAPMQSSAWPAYGTERDAVAAVAPDADARLRVLDAQLQLERVAQPKPPTSARARR